MDCSWMIRIRSSKWASWFSVPQAVCGSSWSWLLIFLYHPTIWKMLHHPPCSFCVHYCTLVSSPFISITSVCIWTYFHVCVLFTPKCHPIDLWNLWALKFAGPVKLIACHLCFNNTSSDLFVLAFVILAVCGSVSFFCWYFRVADGLHAYHIV